MLEAIRHSLTWLGSATAHPTAFVIVGLYGIAWAYFEPDKLDWHGFATLATWLMTLLIQRAEHRDTQAIHAKLDELLRADTRADTGMANMDKKEPEDIEQHRGFTP
jgi:low affinity Fe/Cu permease